MLYRRTFLTGGALAALTRLPSIPARPAEDHVSPPNWFHLVADGGATPADIGPAVQAGLDAVCSGTYGTIYVPPGEWNWTTPVFKNLYAASQHLEIVGEGTSSIIHPHVPVSTGLSLANNYGTVTLRNLVFEGVEGHSPDVWRLLELNAAAGGKYVIDGCGFYGLEAVSPGILTFGGAMAHVRGCHFGASRATGVDGAVVKLNTCGAGALFESCWFTDYGYAGYDGPTKTSGTAWLWLGSGYGAALTADPGVKIVNCLFDEAQNFGVVLEPGLTERIRSAHFDGCAWNACIQQSIKATRVDWLTVERCIVTKNTAPFLLARDVRSLTIRQTQAAASNRVDYGATSDVPRVTIEDCAGLRDANGEPLPTDYERRP